MAEEARREDDIPQSEWGTELELAPAPDQGAPRVPFAPLDLPMEHLGLVPREVAEHFLVVPLRVDEQNIEVAMADPTLDSVVEELEFATGKHVVRVEASASELREAIDRAYAALDEGARLQAGPRRRPTSQAFMRAVVRPDWF